MGSHNRENQKLLNSMLRSTIKSLSKEGLTYKNNITIQGVIGITVDDEEVFIVHMNEEVTSQDFPHSASSSGTNPKAALNQKTSTNIQKCSSKCKISLYKNKGKKGSVVDAGGTTACKLSETPVPQYKILVLHSQEGDKLTYTQQHRTAQGKDLIHVDVLCEEQTLQESNDEGLDFALSNIPYLEEGDVGFSEPNTVPIGTDDLGTQAIGLVQNEVVLKTTEMPCDTEVPPEKPLSVSAIRGREWRQKIKEGPNYEAWRLKEMERFRLARRLKTPEQKARMAEGRMRRYYKRKMALGLPIRRKGRRREKKTDQQLQAQDITMEQVTDQGEPTGNEINQDFSEINSHIMQIKKENTKTYDETEHAYAIKCSCCDT